MGIRESLKRQPEEENLKNFVMPEDELEDELEFDVEKEITPEIWDKMKGLFEFYRKEKHWEMFAYLAMCMVILKPESKEDLNIEDSWQEMVDFLKKERDERLVEIPYLNLAVSMTILYPEKRSEIYIKEKWQGYKDSNHAFLLGDPKSWKTRIGRISDLLVVQPQRRAEFNLDDELYIKAEEIFDGYGENKKWLDFAEMGSSIRLIWPEKELNIGIEEWRKMKQQLKIELRNDTLISFSLLAMHMRILSAKEVKITDHGLELIMPEKKSFQPEKHKRPERRNF